MKVEIEDFNTGWYGLTVGIKKTEGAELISALRKLENENGHFHIRSDYDGSGGVGDIEFYVQNEREQNNMVLDSSTAIYIDNQSS